MSQTVTINGTSYTFPNTGDTVWGDNVTNWAAAVSLHLLQKTGGTFTLSADVNFGASYGLVSLYYKSTNTNIASTGQIRLGSAEVIAWRNNANSGDLPLTTDTSDNLLFGGHIISSSSGVVPVAAGGTGITIYTTGDTLYATGSTTLSKLAIGSADLVKISTGTAPSWGQIVNASVANAAAIAYSKLALTTSIKASDINSQTATSGQLLCADGAGNAVFNATTWKTADTTSGAGTIGTALTISAGNQTVSNGSANGGILTLSSGSATGGTSTGFGGSVIIQSGSGVGNAAGKIKFFTGATEQGSFLAGGGFAIGASGSAVELSYVSGGLQIGATSTTSQHLINTLLGTNGVAVLTLTNGPSGTSGNPTGYISMKINGTTRYIPFW